MALLEVTGLTTQFSSGGGVVKVVDEVSFSVEPGEILGIVGESGSGKSMMALSLINLVDPPGMVAAGQIQLLGKDLRQASEKEWKRIRGRRLAMVFQDPMMSLNPVIRVGHQLLETVTLHQQVTKREAKKLAVAALSRVGIPAPEERMRAYPHELSGGMRQRVAIANALVNRPELIIADEPTTALDVTIQAQILYEVRRLAQETGTAFIWITHDLALLRELADRVCVMYAGRIVESGPVHDIITHPRHPYTRGLIDSLPQPGQRGQRLTPIRGSMPPAGTVPAGCAFVPRCNYAQADCSGPLPNVLDGKRRFRCFHPL
jgi:peptide/nickel transport system ATP-binding protein